MPRFHVTLTATLDAPAEGNAVVDLDAALQREEGQTFEYQVRRILPNGRLSPEFKFISVTRNGGVDE